MDIQQGFVLVVDDVPDILELLDTTLKFKGYRVVTARNGQEALEMIQREHPALIIADILSKKLHNSYSFLIPVFINQAV